MVDDGTYMVYSQAGILTDFDNLLAVVGPDQGGQRWTVTNKSDGTMTLQADTGNYLSFANRAGPYYNSAPSAEPFKVDDEGQLIHVPSGSRVVLSMIRIFPPGVVKDSDMPGMPVNWTFAKR